MMVVEEVASGMCKLAQRRVGGEKVIVRVQMIWREQMSETIL